MRSQIELAKSILESHGYKVTLKESTGKRLKFEDLVKYPYRFSKQWKGAPNSTYGDDLLELAEKYNCLQIKYNNGYNNTEFICRDKSDYENLKDALSQDKTLSNFISLSEIKDMDWDALVGKLQGRGVYVDRYIGGYTVIIPKQRKVKESTEEDLLSKVKKSLDDAGISYTVRGNGSLIVSRGDLRKASEIRDKIDPDYTVTVASRA